MLGDLFFLFRMIVFTCVLVLLMQIQVGGRTLEQHSYAWLRSSQGAEFFHGVAAGAIRFAQDGIYRLIGKEHTDRPHSGSDAKVGGRLNLRFERSKAYLEEQAKKAKDKIHSQVQAYQSTSVDE